MTTQMNVNEQTSEQEPPRVSLHRANATRRYYAHPYTRRLYQTALVATDAILLLVSFGLAYWMRFSLGIGVETYVVPDPEVYWPLILLLVPMWILLLAFMRAYDYSQLFGGTNEYMAVANGVTWGAMIVIVLAFFDVDFSIARAWLVLSWMTALVLLCAGRLAMRRTAYYLRRKGLFVTPALIIGTNKEAAFVAGQVSDSVASGIHVLGFVNTTSEPQDLQPIIDSGFPLLGNVSRLAEIIDRSGAEEVIVSSSSMSRDELFQVTSAIAEQRDVRVYLTSGLYEVLTTTMEVTTRASMPLVSVHRLRLNRTETIMKSVLEGFLILLALPILLPLFGLLALAVTLDSPGPVFYRRRVLGVGGKPFDALKFRTMHINGDQILDAHPELRAELSRNHKLKNDPRITRVGNFLRRYSLDELPQIINVIMGQMSLVGPRMIHPSEQDLYGRMRYNLLTVRPGLTGMWQVSGRSDLSYEERVRLDMYYVRNYSIWLDVQILFFQTIPAVLKGRGAY